MMVITLVMVYKACVSLSDLKWFISITLVTVYYTCNGLVDWPVSQEYNEYRDDDTCSSDADAHDDSHLVAARLWCGWNQVEHSNIIYSTYIMTDVILVSLDSILVTDFYF